MDARSTLRAPPLSARASISVIAKALVAGSGLFLSGWTVLHLFGMLTVFAGAEKMEAYAAWLRQGAGLPLWGLRVALLSAFGVHVWLVLRLWARARRARPIGYASASRLGAAARWLRWGAALLLVLIVGHVLHFSFGVGLPRFAPEHVYDNLIGAFQRSAGMTLVYVAFAALFGLHLVHGLRAATVSLGARVSEKRSRLWATLLGVAIGAGFAVVPLVIALGVVR